MARRAWTTLASPLPDMALRNHSARFAAALRGLLAHEHFDLVQAESIEMAPYLDVVRQTSGAQRPALVLDQFNAEFVLQKRAALTSLQALRRGAFTPRHAAGAAYSLVQWNKLARYERQAMRGCDLVLAVSADDQQTLRRLEQHATIGVVPNGVDSAVFSQSALARERRSALAFAGSPIVFTGTLDFRPNIDAALWFGQEVLPRIRVHRPDARFVVVGKRPAAILGTLPAEAVTIVGEVPDARPFIAGACVYVVPMRIGGGVRLKLLEALALEAPVVSTSMGAEGVDGLRNDEHCLIADDPAAFAAAVLHLLDDQAHAARLGAAGRTLVSARYDWQAIIPQLEALYQQL